MYDMYVSFPISATPNILWLSGVHCHVTCWSSVAWLVVLYIVFTTVHMGFLKVNPPVVLLVFVLFADEFFDAKLQGCVYNGQSVMLY